MARLSLLNVVADDGTAFTRGITALTTIPGSSMVYAAGCWGGGISTFGVTDSGLTLLDRQAYMANTDNFTDATLLPLTVNGKPALVHVTSRATSVDAYFLDSHGMVSPSKVALSAKGGMPERPLDVAAVDGLAVFGQSSGGVASYSVGADGSLVRIGSTGGGAISDVEYYGPEGRRFVVAAATDDDCVDVYRMTSDGKLTRTSTSGADDGIGMNAPTNLAVAKVGGISFVLAGAHESGSITVFRIASKGRLIATDHVYDTLDTRFGGLGSLTVQKWKGGVYVAASGADDGVTLMRLLPGGWLEHVSTVEDTDATTLDNISALALAPSASGTKLLLSATSFTEAGLTAFEVKVGSLGTAQTGVGSDSVVIGTPKEDYLLATSGQDTFRGRGGADTFVFFADGSTDKILDYQRNVDRLDLGGVPLLHSVDQLTIIPRTAGATIQFGEFTLNLRSADAKPLAAGDLRLETTLSHAPTGNVFQSTSAQARPQTVDALGRIVRHNVVDGKTIYDGGGGEDLLTFGKVDGRVIVDLQVNLASTRILKQYQEGEAAGLKIRNFEHLQGGNLSDSLRGEEGVNILRGGRGRDVLLGRAGNDSLDGGAGRDILVGGPGADLLTGGPDAAHDRFVFKSSHDSGPGASERDRINDFNRGEDVIDLSHFDADTTTRGRQHFIFVKTADFSAAGQLRYEHDAGKTMLQADIDGDRIADFEVELAGTLMLTAHDFLF